MLKNIYIFFGCYRSRNCYGCCSSCYSHIFFPVLSLFFVFVFFFFFLKQRITGLFHFRICVYAPFSWQYFHFARCSFVSHRKNVCDNRILRIDLTFPCSYYNEHYNSHGERYCSHDGFDYLVVVDFLFLRFPASWTYRFFHHFSAKPFIIWRTFTNAKNQISALKSRQLHF